MRSQAACIRTAVTMCIQHGITPDLLGQLIAERQAEALQPRKPNPPRKSVPRVLHWPDDGALGRASSGEAQAADSPVQGSAGRAHDQSRFFNR